MNNPNNSSAATSPDDPRYHAIVEICTKSTLVLSNFTKKLGEREALTEAYKICAPFWEEFKKNFPGSYSFNQSKFVSMPFLQAGFDEYQFLNCDFEDSRWIFSFLRNCDCSGSNFSRMNCLLTPFTNGTNCSGCNFTNAKFNWFTWFEKLNYEKADFSNAELTIELSFLNHKENDPRINLSGARMDGCKIIITRDERSPKMSLDQAKEILKSFFTPDQWRVIQIESKLPRCFIASAACGEDSEEVATLSTFRDQVLMNHTLGRILVKMYYRTSPKPASWIEASPRYRLAVRELIIRPMAKLVRGR